MKQVKSTFLFDLKYIFILAELFCHEFLPSNITKSENERLGLSFILCGEPAPRVTWTFGKGDTDHEIVPVKLNTVHYIYSLSLPPLSRNMCGSTLSIHARTSSQEVVAQLGIYVNCELRF